MKRKFITTHDLQLQQKKVSRKSPEVGNWQDSSANTVPMSGEHDDVPVKEKEAVRRKLALQECSGDGVNCGHGEITEKVLFCVFFSINHAFFSF